MALALLCVADRDPDSARWHLREVLAIDPRAPAARQLDNLELGHNRIGQKGAAALASSPHLAHLTRLTLNDPWKPETVALFAKSPSLAAAKVYFKGKLVPKA